MKNWNWSFLFKTSLIIVLISVSWFYVRKYLEHHHRTVISHDKKFVWFWNSKVGGNSIREVLRKNDTSATRDIYLSYKLHPDYFKFAFVRNPWDRAVSCYQDKVVKERYKPFKECYGKDFDYFVDFLDRQNLKIADRHIKLQTSAIPVAEMDFIGRLENFDKDFACVLERLNIENTECPHKNASKHKHYSAYYTPRTQEIIARKYKADIDYFGYTFETVNP